VRVKAVKDGNLTKLYLSHFNLLGETWEEHTLNQRTINTMDMRNIQHIAALSYEIFGKGNIQRNPLIGPGILSLDAPAYKHAREMVKPVFSRAQLSDIESFERHVDRFIELIPKEGGKIEIQAPLHKLVLLPLLWHGWMITDRN
jgi:cytochrome P450